jgi:soluble lytic murein transglycosylase-like protein
VISAVRPAAAGLAPAEVETLARVAAWFAEGEAAAETDEILEAIRKDPKGFSLFAGSKDQVERGEVLANVPFAAQIAKAAAAHQVDSLLVASVVEVESTFDPEAGSHKGAVGLMQLLPSTAGMSRSKLLEPSANLAAGSAYLAEMIERFDGDLGLALAAYNAGPTNVRRHEGVPPFPETEQYVEKVLSRYVEYHRQLWRVSRGIDLGTVVS